MNKQPQTCYVEVSTEERNPEKQGLYHVISDGEKTYNHFSEGKWFEINPDDEPLDDIHFWLEKKESVYLHTPEELALAFREKAEKVWDAAILSSLPIGEPLDTDEAYKNYVRKQQYLDQHYPKQQPLK